MNKEQQDKLWNELSEEQRQHHIKNCKKYIENVEDHIKNNRLPQAMFNKGMIAILDEVFGLHNLNPKPTPKTWKDIKEGEIIKEIQENFSDLGSHCYIDCNYEGYIPSKIINKMIATAKIAKLIDLGYGGLLSEDEWEDDSENKYVITRSYKGGLRFECSLYDRAFIAFHTEQQLEEFMSHESNRKLVEQYYMM